MLLLSESESGGQKEKEHLEFISEGDEILLFLVKETYYVIHQRFVEEAF